MGDLDAVLQVDRVQLAHGRLGVLAQRAYRRVANLPVRHHEGQRQPEGRKKKGDEAMTEHKAKQLAAYGQKHVRSEQQPAGQSGGAVALRSRLLGPMVGEREQQVQQSHDTAR